MSAPPPAARPGTAAYRPPLAADPDVIAGLFAGAAKATAPARRGGRAGASLTARMRQAEREWDEMMAQREAREAALAPRRAAGMAAHQRAMEQRYGPGRAVASAWPMATMGRIW